MRKKKKEYPRKMFCPGRTIARELQAREWDEQKLAEATGFQVKFVLGIISGVVEITPEIADKLGLAFGTSAEFWLNLEKSYRSFLNATQEGMGIMAIFDGPAMIENAIGYVLTRGPRSGKIWCKRYADAVEKNICCLPTSEMSKDDREVILTKPLLSIVEKVEMAQKRKCNVRLSLPPVYYDKMEELRRRGEKYDKSLVSRAIEEFIKKQEAS